MLLGQIILILILSVSATAIEIFLEYPKRCTIGYKSWHFLYLSLFNIVIGYSLFFLNINKGSKFLNITNPWVLAALTGLSGFLFFNSKMHIQQVIKNKDFSSIKSVFSGIKTILNGELREYIEREHPFELISDLQEMIPSKNLSKYYKFVKNSIHHFTKENNKKRAELLKLLEGINSIEENSKEDKIYYLTETLLDIKDPCWVKKNVVSKFYKKK